MTQENRKGEKPIPDNYQQMLNIEQKLALRHIESFGWQLKFIRRPLFQKIIAVVVSPDGREMGVLEEDGRINTNSNIIVRK